MGLYNGIFFTIFISNQVLGNVTAAILFGNVDIVLVFSILAAFGALGLFVIFFLRKVQRPEIKKINGDHEKEVNPLLEVLFFFEKKKKKKKMI